MDRQSTHNIKLGVFVLTGTIVLILSLFLIGKYRHLLGSYFNLRAEFGNAAGLKIGNNVRYAGIEVGTVRSISITSDTTVEVVMLISSDMKELIKKNAIASIGADGIMGNKVVNIVPDPGISAPPALDNDVIRSERSVDMDDILKILSISGGNVVAVTEALKTTVARINNSHGLWETLSDSGLARSLKRASVNLEQATRNADLMSSDLKGMVTDLRAGKGLGGLLRDTLLATELHGTLRELQDAAATGNHLAMTLDSMVSDLSRNIREGPGAANLVLRDSSAEGNLRRTLENVEKGTASFNENMEAMRHNFLFRGYFRKQEKEKARQLKKLAP